MRIALVILNAFLFIFLTVVVLAEGPPDPGADTVSIVLSILTKVFSGLTILLTVDSGRFIGFYSRMKAMFEAERTGKPDIRVGNLVTLAMICDIVGLGFVCWHLTGQLHHPDEAGVIPLAILQVLTPVLNVLVLSRSVGKSVTQNLR